MSAQKYASLILLSYKRPDYLRRTLQTLKANTPRCEIIVVDDGSRGENWTLIFQALREGKISTAIVNGGKNRGVGEGIRRGFAIAGGDYLVKLDSDLEFRPGWLEAGMHILDTMPDVGVAGWFDYLDYDKTRDAEFGTIETRMTDWRMTVAPNAPDEPIAQIDLKVKIVKDFVSSAMMIRRSDYEKFGAIDSGSTAFAEDKVYKDKMTAAGMKLAITDPAFVVNFGFGLGKSTVVVEQEGRPVVASIHTEPYLV